MINEKGGIYMVNVVIIAANDNIDTVMPCYTITEAINQAKAAVSENEYQYLIAKLIDGKTGKPISEMLAFPLSESEKQWLNNHTDLDQIEAITALRTESNKGKTPDYSLSIKLEYLSPQKYLMLVDWLQQKGASFASDCSCIPQ
jgi:hypothetical protein